MGTELQKTAEVKVLTPILDIVNPAISRLLGKNLAEIAAEVTHAVELGLKTDESARTAEACTQRAIRAIKTVQEIRMTFTRPIDEGKKRIMQEFEFATSRLVAQTEKLKQMGLKRAADIRKAEAKALAEAEAEQKAADEKAAKELERRQNISKAQGGTGENVKPVVAEKINIPISTAGLRTTTRTRQIVDNDAIRAAIADGVRNIEGVNIYPVWEFKITDPKTVPDEYKKITRA